MPDSVPQVSFDRSLLPPAVLEFIVVADTHYMVDVGDAPLEFESRRKQGDRAGAAWRAIGALDPEFVVHLGDIVQEFPGRPDYDRAIREALGQIDDAGVRARCRFVVGNHDIGDPPDPTMPTGETTEDSLQGWESLFGPSWQTWDAAGMHFLAMNSQLLNTSMPEAREQRGWLEARLAEFGEEPCVLFLHMPPYLHDPAEPGLGHYDNLGEPDRSWLLELVRRHNIQALFAGHVHFQFHDHIEGQRSTCSYHTTLSTSFTRPGFSHLFTSAPPPEQGRDDVPKLGFFLCRVVGGHLDIHRIRLESVTAAAGEPLVVTPISSLSTGAGSGFAVGVSLRHALAPETQVPLAWPSVIRQTVRNDYPALACFEMGIAAVRAPAADLADPTQARRLRILRDEGVAVQAVVLGEGEALDRAGSLADSPSGADRLEVQLPGRCLPDADALRALKGDLPLVLAPVLPGQKVPGKQHSRTRIGFAPAELDELGRLLEDARISASVACRLDPGDPWDMVRELREARAARGWDILLLAELPGLDDAANAAAVVRAIVAAASLDVELYLEPLVDMDRTMDVCAGLLDTRCNPRVSFDAARSAAALVRAHGGVGAALSAERRAGCEVVALGENLCLVMPHHPGASLTQAIPWDRGATYSVCRLSAGSMVAEPDELSLSPDTGPLLAIRSA